MLEVAISCSNVSINWLNRKQKSNLTQRQGGKKTKEKDKKKKRERNEMRSERINTLYGKYWEVRGEKSGQVVIPGSKKSLSCPFPKVSCQGQLGQPWREHGPWHAGPRYGTWLKSPW